MKTPMPLSDLVWQDILAVRNAAPLVHNITNFVVMNVTANALLAAGASPVMAHAAEEVEDMVKIAGALVINIGTLEPDWVASMESAMRAAKSFAKPIVLDPVGAGATPYRNGVLNRLLMAAAPGVIRGNASEIMAVAGLAAATKGVDSAAGSDEALLAGRELARRIGGVVCISGQVDYVVAVDGREARLANGHPWMTRITGTGCSATALIGAFCAVQPDAFRATISAMSLIALAGEIATEQVQAQGQGVGSLQARLLDQLQLIEAGTVSKHLRAELA